jgi:hypothetical protein
MVSQSESNPPDPLTVEGSRPPAVGARGGSHLVFTRINIQLTFLKNQVEEKLRF